MDWLGGWLQIKTFNYDEIITSEINEVSDNV